MGLSLVIDPKIVEKLRNKHQVSEAEVEQAFLNRIPMKLASETRPGNQGSDPRYWFISETDAQRRLKVVFALPPKSPPIIITAYEPNVVEEQIYAKELAK